MADAPDPYEEFDKKMREDLSILREKLASIISSALIIRSAAFASLDGLSQQQTNSIIEKDDAGSCPSVAMVLTLTSSLALLAAVCFTIFVEERELWWMRTRQSLDPNNIRIPQIQPPQYMSEFISRLLRAINGSVLNHPVIAGLNFAINQRTQAHSSASSAHSVKSRTLGDLRKYLIANKPRDETSIIHGKNMSNPSSDINYGASTSRGGASEQMKQTTKNISPQRAVHTSNPSSDINYGASTSTGGASEQMKQTTKNISPRRAVHTSNSGSDINFRVSTRSNKSFESTKQTISNPQITCITPGSTTVHEVAKSRKVSSSMKKLTGDPPAKVTQRCTQPSNVSPEEGMGRQRRKSRRLAQQQELRQASEENEPSRSGELRRRIDDQPDKLTETKKRRSSKK